MTAGVIINEEALRDLAKRRYYAALDEGSTVTEDLLSEGEGDADAEAGLAMAKHVWYDIVMLDIQLNGGPGGLDMLRALRALSAYTYAPILAVTAYALPGDSDRFLDAGFDAYLAKPFTRDELLWALEDVVAARTAAPPE